MGIKIIDRKVFTDFFNGPNLDLNPSDFKYHLYGSVGNMTKIVYTINVDWGTRSSITDYMFKTSGNDIINREGGSFIDDGFSIGDTVDYKEYKNYTLPATLVASGSGTITAIADDFVVISGLNGVIPTGKWGDGGQTDGFHYIEIFGTNALTGFLMNFGLIANDAPINFESALDETSQGYYVAVVSAAYSDAKFLGAYRGSQTGSMRVKSLPNPSTYVQQFEVEHIVRIIPYWLEGQTDDLTNLITPEPFQGNDSLKYVSQYEFRNVISDENTAKTIQDEQQLGSVSWFNENYNGFNNIFTITDLSYEDLSGDPSNSLIVGATTKVIFKVASEENSFVNAASSIVQVMASFLPDQDDYQFQKETYTEIWEIEQYRTNVGVDVATGQQIITNVKIDFVDAKNIDVELEVLYTGKASTDQYVLGIEVANDGITSDTSNKTLLKIDNNTFQKSACIENLITNVSIQIEDHEGEVVDEYGGFIEDGILLPYSFELNHALEARIESMEVLVVAFNPTTRDFFTINSEVIQIENQAQKTDTYSYQEITTDITVGYKLDLADPFNHRTINTGALVGPLRNYNGVIGVKIPWQDWLQLVEADEQFFDVTKPFDGLNKQSSNYNLTNGYELRPWLKIGMSGLNDLGVRGETDYYLSTPGMVIGGYNDNSGVTVAITYKDSLGSPISKVLLSNENTNIRVLVSPNPDAIPVASYGILRLEVYTSFGDKEIYELSSIKPNFSENAFAGLLVKNVLGSDLEFLGEIKSAFIRDSTDYKVSFMLKCPAAECIIIMTNMNAPIDGPFNPSVDAFTGPDDFTWKFEDSSVLSGASISTMANGLDGTAQVVKLCTEDASKITNLSLSNDKIIGSLDVSICDQMETLSFQDNLELTGLTLGTGVDMGTCNWKGCDLTGVLDLSNRNWGGTTIAELLLHTNPNLTGVTFSAGPNNTGASSNRAVNIYNCNLTGNIDMTSWVYMGSLSMQDNLLLTSISFGVGPLTFRSGISAQRCDITGVLDLSDFTQIYNGNASLFWWENSNLTSVLLPITISGGTDDIRIHSCDLTGNFDMTTLGSDELHVYLYNNPNLTAITLATSATIKCDSFWVYNCSISTVNFLSMSTFIDVNGAWIRLEDNGMTTAEVNKILVDLDTISLIGFTGTIQINGTNAAPDGSAGGNDGAAAVISLGLKGRTVLVS